MRTCCCAPSVAAVGLVVERPPQLLFVLVHVKILPAGGE